MHQTVWLTQKVNLRPLCILILGLMLGLLFAAHNFSSANAAEAPKGTSSTRVVSDKMTYDAAKNQVVFEGKVHVTRPTMEIWSDLLTLTLENTGKKSAGADASGSSHGLQGGKLDKIVAERNVRIQQGDRSGTSGRATYYVNEGRIVLEQNPVLIDGMNRIKGDKIVYYTETGKSDVIGRVDVQIVTSDSASPSLPGVPGQDAQDKAGQ